MTLRTLICRNINAGSSPVTKILHQYILMIPVPLRLEASDLDLNDVCVLQADLTSIPRNQYLKRKSPSGRLYHRLNYSIGMTFRNTIAFELIHNGKVFGAVSATYT